MKTIAEATAADIPLLAELARQFYSASRVLRGFDMQRFETLWRTLLESGAGVIFILKSDGQITGTIGGMMHPELYSGELLAVELFWFVDEAQRGQGIRLYRRFEQWAREKGCAEIRMAHLVDSMPEKVAAFYERVGYAKIETLFAKRLQGEK